MNAKALNAILVPLDGSALAERALPAAMGLAEATHAALHLVTVQPPMPFLTTDTPIPPDMLEEEGARLEAYLRDTAMELSARCGSPVRHALVFGQPAASLGKYAGSNAIDLIVMTTHGRSGLTRMALGSVAEALLRSVTVPVLLFTPETATADGPTRFATVLVALDGMSGSDVIVDAAVALGGVAHATAYTLVHVIENPPPMLARIAFYPERVAPAWRERREARARRALDPMADQLREGGLTASVQLLAGYPVSRQLLDFARTSGSDLLVMGTHAPRGAERVLLGSVADDVIRHADRPVLVVPTRATERRVQRVEAASTGKVVV